MTEPQPRILVVDDEENIRYLVTTALRLAGMDTIARPPVSKRSTRSTARGPT